MRVFVTGATGFIGSAVVRELLDAGHQVRGLARPDTGAAALGAMGAQVYRGSLGDLESLRSGAAASDGVVHAAYDHDFSKAVENGELDRRAIGALGTALEGSGRPLVVTAGVAFLSPDHVATEDTPAPTSAGMPRVSEQTALAMASRGMRVSVVRLPPSVHGDGDHGFIPAVIGMARTARASAYVGDGLNRWPAVHRLDAARLYRLVLEHGASGARYHGIAEEGVSFREIAGVIGRRLGLPVVARSLEEATSHFSWFARFAGMDSPASSVRTEALLGWAPQQPGLIADIDRPQYFES